jgi:hypothetical protein
MNHFSNPLFGLLFVGVGSGASFLMFYPWGFPFDHSTHKSEAPRPLMLLHGLGYLYAAIFVYLMIQMVPRLWNYQIELPARTVAHLIIGLVIGITLLIKITIQRFFKHLESTLAPFLGTLLLICTIVLIGLSVPTALREVLASRQETFLPDNVERVRAQFDLAGLQPGKPLWADDLRTGRRYSPRDAWPATTCEPSSPGREPHRIGDRPSSAWRTALHRSTRLTTGSRFK